MQPKNRNKASDFTPTPMSEILGGISATNQPGPLDDLPQGVPLGQMWDVVNGKLDAKDVTQDPNIEPELQQMAKRADAGVAEAAKGQKFTLPVGDLGTNEPEIGTPGTQGFGQNQGKYLTAAQAGINGMGQKFQTEEDAVLAFFQQAQARTSADPKGVKPEYGADIARFKDDDDFYYIYAKIGKSPPNNKSIVSFTGSQFTVAVAHTHPKEETTSSLVRDVNTDNELLTGTIDEDGNATGDIGVLTQIQAKVDKHKMYQNPGEELKIRAYLARPDGHIHQIEFPWEDRGVKVFPNFRFKY